MNLRFLKILLLGLAVLCVRPQGLYAQQKSSPDATVVYVYDALCGWCYGFSPVMERVHKKYRNVLDFRVVSVGLVVEQRIGPIGEVAPIINEAYKVVEEKTGVSFGEEFLRVMEEGSETFTSLPAAVAMAVFRLYEPDKVVEYAAALQNAIYWEGMPTEPYEGYALIASTFGIDETAFLKKMNMDMLQQEGYADFSIAADLGATAFPSVFIQHGGRFYKIASGYVEYEDLVASIERVLESIGAEGSPDKWYEEH
jgi:putative protein-disulfide isomerase